MEHKKMWWNEVASSLQTNSSDWGDNYDKENIPRMVTHTRQDLILCVSYLSSLNEQLDTTNKKLGTTNKTLKLIAGIGIALILVLLSK